MALKRILEKLTGKNISDREGIEMDLAEFYPTTLVFSTNPPRASEYDGRVTVVHKDNGEIIEILLDEPDDSHGLYA